MSQEKVILNAELIRGVVSETPPGPFLCSFPGVRVISVLTLSPPSCPPLSVSPVVTHLSSVNLRLDVGDS